MSRAPDCVERNAGFRLTPTAFDLQPAEPAIKTLRYRWRRLRWSAINYYANGSISMSGWARLEELERSHVGSRYAFFARQFKNPELDDLFDRCLRKAVAETGYELRTVTQKAGHIDAIIEDEIRRCRFLIADLSDDNAGAYWEAGFAEGLGKDVISYGQKIKSIRKSGNYLIPA
jgi:hypothetical protein